MYENVYFVQLILLKEREKLPDSEYTTGKRLDPSERKFD